MAPIRGARMRRLLLFMMIGAASTVLASQITPGATAGVHPAAVSAAVSPQGDNTAAADAGRKAQFANILGDLSLTKKKFEMATIMGGGAHKSHKSKSAEDYSPKGVCALVLLGGSVLTCFACSALCAALGTQYGTTSSSSSRFSSLRMSQTWLYV